MKQIVSKNTVFHFILFLLIFGTSNMVFSQTPNLGIFDQSNDIGKCNTKGSAIYNPATQEYTISGSGENIWKTKDAFHYLYKQMKGDFIIQFEFEFTTPVKNNHWKIGWMVRNDTTSNSAHVIGTMHDDGLSAIQYRLAKGDSTREIRMKNLEKNNIVQLERRGNRYIYATAIKGEEFKTIEWIDSARVINDNAQVGIFICSHNKSDLQTAKIRNVRITVPAKANFKRFGDTISTNIEIMDIETMTRKIAYTSPVLIFAPNWTVDGKSLIYNGNDGLMYNFNLKTAKPTLIDTKNVVKNNNDHALSWDGKMLGLSSFGDVEKGRKSMMYIVPTIGGTPTLITTEKDHSYFHGFSLDGKEMLFTGEREDKGNQEIFSINIKTKVETRLTNSPGLDDGSEYSPDGKYIYFNSVRSGKMQIWRMKPDGSNPERITTDEWNNWFPHVSPNGKYIVYITFGNDVLPGEHPLFKHVSIRLMDLETRKITVLAHLYGGQGTINVPSWSPDSKKVAFMTFTCTPAWNTKCY